MSSATTPLSDIRVNVAWMWLCDVPTAGQVWIGGEEITSMSDDQLTVLRRRHLGFVGEHVQTGGDAARAELGDQRVLVDDLAACRVDEHRAVP